MQHNLPSRTSLMCSNQPVIFDQLITLAIDCNGLDILPVNNFVHRVTLVKLVVILWSNLYFRLKTKILSMSAF